MSFLFICFLTIFSWLLSRETHREHIEGLAVTSTSLPLDPFPDLVSFVHWSLTHHDIGSVCNSLLLPSLFSPCLHLVLALGTPWMLLGSRPPFSASQSLLFALIHSCVCFLVCIWSIDLQACELTSPIVFLFVWTIPFSLVSHSLLVSDFPSCLLTSRALMAVTPQVPSVLCSPPLWWCAQSKSSEATFT